MSAIPKIYTNSGCTTELTKVEGTYTLQVGAETGLNGDDGDSATVQLWLKNTGDETYQGVSITETADSGTRASYSLDNSTYHATTISLGDIAAAANKTFYVKVTVEEDAPAGRYTFGFKVSGSSI